MKTVTIVFALVAMLSYGHSLDSVVKTNPSETEHRYLMAGGTITGGKGMRGKGGKGMMSMSGKGGKGGKGRL
jgi:hypothetical protein